MKNILLLGAFLCIVFTSKAQFTTGQKMIGGVITGGFNNGSITGTPQKTKSGDIDLSVSFSKFKSPTQFNSIGISYGYGHSSSSAPNDESSSNVHGISVFVDRTKLQRLADRFYFTYTGSATVAANLSKDQGTNAGVLRKSQRNTYFASVSGGIGLLYQLNDRFLMSCNLSNILNVTYAYYEVNRSVGLTADPTSYNHAFRVTGGLSGLSLNNLGIGFKYMLKKK